MQMVVMYTHMHTVCSGVCVVYVLIHFLFCVIGRHDCRY